MILLAFAACNPECKDTRAGEDTGRDTAPDTHDSA